MKKCKNCGSVYESSYKACPYCGTPYINSRKTIITAVSVILIFSVIAFSAAGIKSHIKNKKTGETQAPVTISSQSVNEAEPTDISTMPFYSIRYFYADLTADEKEVFSGLYKAVMSFEKRFDLPKKISENSLKKIYYVLDIECPELFQFDRGLTTYYTTGRENKKIKYIEMDYAIPQQEYFVMRREAEEVLEGFKSATSGMSDSEKEKFVYDELTKTGVYDKDIKYSDNAWGSLKNRRAKCDGYSDGMKWAMEYLGIPCMVIGGKEPGEPIGHAWNIIKIDGKYSCLDLTWGLKDEKSAEFFAVYPGASYNVYNTSDNCYSGYVINEEYSYMRPYPQCKDPSGSYYAGRNEYVYALGDADSIFEESLNRGFTKELTTASIQFESRAEYESFKENINDKLQTFADKRYKKGYTCSTLYSDETNLLLTYIKPKK